MAWYVPDNQLPPDGSRDPRPASEAPAYAVVEAKRRERRRNMLIIVGIAVLAVVLIVTLV